MISFKPNSLPREGDLRVHARAESHSNGGQALWTLLPPSAAEPESGHHTGVPGKAQVSLRIVVVFIFFNLIFLFSLGYPSVTDTYRVIQITIDTTVEEVMVQALDQFGLDSVEINRYRLVEVSQEKGCKCEQIKAQFSSAKTVAISSGYLLICIIFLPFSFLFAHFFKPINSFALWGRSCSRAHDG